MKTVEVYAVGAKAHHLAYCPEHRNKKERVYTPHCGADPGGMSIVEMALENLKLECEDCADQARLLKEAFLK